MFIYNVKLSGSKLFKTFFVIVAILVIILFGLSAYKIFTKATKDMYVSDIANNTDVANITTQNYTNILKTVHDDLDTYVGQKIKFSGYVYRVYDLSSEQFVLARNMVISSDFQTLVVGFLCNYKDASNFKDGTWVELTGEITKGNYHGEIPEIKVTKIQETEKPSDEYVYPPDDSYVPTSSIM